MIAAAPTKETLKAASSAIYKTIDDMGVTISPGPYSRLVTSLSNAVKRKGGHPKTTPNPPRHRLHADEQFAEVVSGLVMYIKKRSSGGRSEVEED